MLLFPQKEDHKGLIKNDYLLQNPENVLIEVGITNKLYLTGIWLDIIIIMQVFLCLVLFIYRP